MNHHQTEINIGINWIFAKLLQLLEELTAQPVCWTGTMFCKLLDCIYLNIYINLSRSHYHFKSFLRTLLSAILSYTPYFQVLWRIILQKLFLNFYFRVRSWNFSYLQLYLCQIWKTTYHILAFLQSTFRSSTEASSGPDMGIWRP